MKFPLNKWEELPLSRRNTLQIFITNDCNLKCMGCFARHVMTKNGEYISLEEYHNAVDDFLQRGGKQINLLGGEPMLHPRLKYFLELNRKNGIKTTIYTNGYMLDKYKASDFEGVTVRVSLYCQEGKLKSLDKLAKTGIAFDANFMVASGTKVEDLLETAYQVEKEHNSKVFFIFSMRELDNPRKEFFDDTENTMPVIQYKELVHNFMTQYEGSLDIHVSKRGVFESSQTLPDTKCRFSNYFIGGKIIQCPYDIVNLKYQDDYKFNHRFCQHNNVCLMSKVIYRRRARMGLSMY